MDFPAELAFHEPISRDLNASVRRVAMKALLPLLAILALTAPAHAADTPMVWAFHHFCADETFALDEARLAVAVAGGKQRGPATRLPNALSITVWDIVIEGRKLSVSLGGQRVPAG